MLIILGTVLYSSAETGAGMLLKYISGCELDLNGDNNADITLLLETTNGRQLIVLLSNSKGYNAFILSKDKPNMSLSCHFGKSIKETAAGKGKKDGREYHTLGTYIQLKQPEGSSVVYFWHQNGFKEVWTSD